MMLVSILKKKTQQRSGIFLYLPLRNYSRWVKGLEYKTILTKHIADLNLGNFNFAVVLCLEIAGGQLIKI